MNLYSALIIDDEAHCLRTLSQQLAWVDLDIEIVAAVNSVEKAILFLKSGKKKPTFIFLDIHMGDENGFELLEKVNISDSFVIFTTAYEQYALQAFKKHASGYLTKPISTDELESLLHSILEKNKTKEKTQVLKISTRNGVAVLDLNAILYAQAEGSYVKVFCENGETKVISKNLKSLTESLSGSHFMRIHNKFLVNTRKIISVAKGDKPAVKLNAVTELPISRSRKEEVFKFFQNL